ncbi:MAG: hypothetical protein ACRD34_00025 [Bryobacteraceae bacterium]
MSARKKLKPAPVQLNTLLIVPEQFLVLTVTHVEVHVLHETAVTGLWQALAIADTRTRPEPAREYVIKQFFGRNAVGFLPAGSVEALLWLSENYAGILAEEVKGICACILTGTPFGPPDDSASDGGGLTVAPPVPQQPTGPTGATFDLIGAKDGA